MSKKMETLWDGFHHLTWDKVMTDAKYIRLLLELLKVQAQEYRKYDPFYDIDETELK